MKNYYVYIMSNKSKTLYVGMTNNLIKRVYEHKAKLVPSFTSRYNITKLVYFETTPNVYAAIAREKQIKGWLREKKIALINSMNPEWKDLSDEWFDKDTFKEFIRERSGTEKNKGKDSSLTLRVTAGVVSF